MSGQHVALWFLFTFGGSASVAALVYLFTSSGWWERRVLWARARDEVRLRATVAEIEAWKASAGDAGRLSVVEQDEPGRGTP